MHHVGRLARAYAAYARHGGGKQLQPAEDVVDAVWDRNGGEDVQAEHPQASCLGRVCGT